MRDTTKQAAVDAQARLRRSVLVENKRILRRDIGQLAGELNALLPKYWWWVESSKYSCDRDKLLQLTQAAEERFSDLPTLKGLYRDLCELEHTFTVALSGPSQRRVRKMFI